MRTTYEKELVEVLGLKGVSSIIEGNQGVLINNHRWFKVDFSFKDIEKMVKTSEKPVPVFFVVGGNKMYYFLDLGKGGRRIRNRCYPESLRHLNHAYYMGKEIYSNFSWFKAVNYSNGYSNLSSSLLRLNKEGIELAFCLKGITVNSSKGYVTVGFREKPLKYVEEEGYFTQVVDGTDIDVSFLVSLYKVIFSLKDLVVDGNVSVRLRKFLPYSREEAFEFFEKFLSRFAGKVVDEEYEPVDKSLSFEERLKNIEFQIKDWQFKKMYGG